MARLPDFLIVGAAKSGTTSLFEYLGQHPDVFVPARKEPSYFATTVPTRLKELDAYQELFARAGGHKRAGEASVAYLYDPTAPEGIRQTLGAETKIIIMLRNPIDMMYSMWGHMTRVGGETLSFEEALDAEQARLDDPAFTENAISWIDNFAYRRRATYSPQVERYLSLFGRENVLVVIYEEFFENPTQGFGAVCDFLGIPKSFTPRFDRHNPAGTVRSKLLRSALNERSTVKSIYTKLVPTGIRQRIRDVLERVNRRPEPLRPLSQAKRERFATMFVEDVRHLERLIGRSLEDTWRI